MITFLLGILLAQAPPQAPGVALRKPPPPLRNDATRKLSVEKANGGSIAIAFGSGSPFLYQNSSLLRTWLTVNDSTCPVSASGLGLNVKYNDGKYIVGMAGGAVIANDSVRAVHLVFVTFNIWGERLTGLRVSKLEDVDAGKPVPIHDGWYLRDADIQEFATSVAYVDRVLLADGSIWRADRAAIARILSETSYRISEASLDPDSRKGANP